MSSNRVLYQAAIISFIASFSSLVISFGIGFQVLEANSSALGFALTQCLGPLLIFLMQPVTKRLFKRFRLGQLIMGCQYMSLVLMLLSFAYLHMLLGSIKGSLDSLLLVILLAAVNSYISLVFGIAYDLNLKRLVDNTEIKRLRSAEELAGTLSVLLSPILASVLYDHLTLSGLFVVGMVSDLLALGLIRQLGQAGDDERIEQSSREATQAQATNSAFRPLVTWTCLLAVSFVGLNIGLTHCLVQEYGANTQTYGLAKIAWSIGMLLSSGLLLPKLLKIRSLPLVVGLISTAFVLTGIHLYLTQGQVYQQIGMILAYFIFGFLVVVYRVELSSFLMQGMDEDLLGHFYSQSRAAEALSRGLAALLFAFFFDRFTSGPVFLAVGLILILSLPYLGYALTKFKALENN